MGNAIMYKFQTILSHVHHMYPPHPHNGRTAAYGHFGREPEADGGFSWEKIDLVDTLHKAIG